MSTNNHEIEPFLAFLLFIVEHSGDKQKTTTKDLTKGTVHVTCTRSGFCKIQSLDFLYIGYNKKSSFFKPQLNRIVTNSFWLKFLTKKLSCEIWLCHQNPLLNLKFSSFQCLKCDIDKNFAKCLYYNFEISSFLYIIYESQQNKRSHIFS